VIEEEKLVERAAELGGAALAQLRARLAGRSGVADVRGRGLLLAIECDTPERSHRTCDEALRRGVIVVPSGDDGRVIAVTPPLSIDADALAAALDGLAECIA